MSTFQIKPTILILGILFLLCSALPVLAYSQDIPRETFLLRVLPNGVHVRIEYRTYKDHRLDSSARFYILHNQVIAFTLRNVKVSYATDPVSYAQRLFNVYLSRFKDRFSWLNKYDAIIDIRRVGENRVNTVVYSRTLLPPGMTPGDLRL